MKCNKCKSKIAVVKWGIANICLPCIYNDVSRKAVKLNMPFTKHHLQQIRDGKKWTTLRSLKYNKYPFERIRIWVSELGIYNFPDDITDNITNEVVISEGYKTFEELITAIKKMRHKLPKSFLLYNLRKPINNV